MIQVSIMLTLFLGTIMCLLGILSLYRRQQSLRRILEFSESVKVDTSLGPREHRRRIRRWLALAGFRHAAAPLLFVSVMVLSTWIALGCIFMMYHFHIVDAFEQSVAKLPGSFGWGLGVAVSAMPWIVFCLIGGAPFFVVRGIRQQRIVAVEQDLPLFLDLLSTLVETGMNFDSALAKILSSQPAGRPLTKEFRVFQQEVSLGISRLRCFRRLAQRLAIPSISLFTSAIVQSEQLGASVAHTLRRQANELRHRRQEHAMHHAQGLSVKLVFPLVLCFLPGIFLTTLGPTIYQLIQILGGVMGTF
ncbi:MAG: membrane protein [Nitrospirales bacterium]|nr:MAG: membrane protein [Nitrospirales bacterium]